MVDDILPTTRQLQNLSVCYIGVALNLFPAIERAQGSDFASISKHAGIDLGYGRRWLDAAVECGVVRQVDGRYSLTAAGQDFANHRSADNISKIIQSIYSVLIADSAVALFRSGARPGYSIVNSFSNLVPFYGLVMSNLFLPRFSQEIMPLMRSSGALDGATGTIGDYWGGDGAILAKMLEGLPDEWHGHLIGSTSAWEGRGRLTNVSEVEFKDRKNVYNVLMASRVVHHFGANMLEKLTAIHHSLRDGGVFFIWDFSWPENAQAEVLTKLGDLAFLNLIEHIQGNHFLTQAEFEVSLLKAGFGVTVVALQDGKELLIEARKNG